MRRMNITVGVSSGCDEVTRMPWLSRRECIDESIGLQGNVFNYRPEECRILKCDDLAELKYTKEQGAWEVFAMQGKIRILDCWPT